MSEHLKHEAETVTDLSVELSNLLDKYSDHMTLAAAVGTLFCVAVEYVIAAHEQSRTTDRPDPA